MVLLVDWINGNVPLYPKILFGKLSGYSIGTLVVALLVLVWQYDAAVTWVAGRVPLATEYKLGESVLASLDTQKSLVSKGVAVNAVKKIGDRLDERLTL